MSPSLRDSTFRTDPPALSTICLILAILPPAILSRSPTVRCGSGAKASDAAPVGDGEAGGAAGRWASFLASSAGDAVESPMACGGMAARSCSRSRSDCGGGGAISRVSSTALRDKDGTDETPGEDRGPGTGAASGAGDETEGGGEPAGGFSRALKNGALSGSGLLSLDGGATDVRGDAKASFRSPCPGFSGLGPAGPGSSGLDPVDLDSSDLEPSDLDSSDLKPSGFNPSRDTCVSEVGASGVRGCPPGPSTEGCCIGCRGAGAEGMKAASFPPCMA